MKITLEQSLASAVRYIQDCDEESIKVYFDEVPEDYAVPSLYFPVPQTSSRKVSLSTYMTEITVNCRFMDVTDWRANDRATTVRDCLLLDDCVIPIVSAEGEVAEKGLHTDQPEVRRIDEGIVQLSFPIRSYYGPGDKAQKMAHFYNMWHKATEEYRRR